MIIISLIQRPCADTSGSESRSLLRYLRKSGFPLPREEAYDFLVFTLYRPNVAMTTLIEA